LVGDGGDFVGVGEDAGDELLAGAGEAEFGVGVVECVDVAFEEGHVGVHGGAGVVGEGFGHEGGGHVIAVGNEFGDVPEGHDGVAHGENVGVAQVDFLLAGGGFMVGEFHGNAHVFQGEHGVAAEVGGEAAVCLVEVAAVIGGFGGPAVGFLVFDEIEFDFGADFAGEAFVSGSLDLAAQHLAGVGVEGLTVGVEDVAEHAGGFNATVADTEGEQLEGGGVGHGDGVGFGDARKPLDGRTVKPDAFGERAF
jgi:predicted NAD/FAD-dependent oxidoreductase